MKEISVQELKNKIDNNIDFQLIDVREDWENADANIGGLNIPLGVITLETDKIDLEKEAIIYCRSGKRSMIAITILEQHGFNNLINLKGGIVAWANEIDPTITV